MLILNQIFDLFLNQVWHCAVLFKQLEDSGSKYVSFGSHYIDITNLLSGLESFSNMNYFSQIKLTKHPEDCGHTRRFRESKHCVMVVFGNFLCLIHYWPILNKFLLLFLDVILHTWSHMCVNCQKLVITFDRCYFFIELNIPNHNVVNCSDLNAVSP